MRSLSLEGAGVKAPRRPRPKLRGRLRNRVKNGRRSQSGKRQRTPQQRPPLLGKTNLQVPLPTNQRPLEPSLRRQRRARRLRRKLQRHPSRRRRRLLRKLPPKPESPRLPQRVLHPLRNESPKFLSAILLNL